MTHFFRKLIGLWRDYQTYRRTMREWLGEGGQPVTRATSQARTDMCLDCKWNKPGTAIELLGKFMRVLQAKNRAKLSVAGEELLHTCSLCSCHLPTKVHVPFKHIRAWQREEVRQKITHGKAECWQLRL